MIKAICSSKTYQVQSMGSKDEPATVYQLTFRVNSLASDTDSVRFTIVVSKLEFDHYEVNKSYTLGKA